MYTKFPLYYYVLCTINANNNIFVMALSDFVLMIMSKAINLNDI